MAWKIEFSRTAEKELGKLDKPVIHRILKFFKERVQQYPKSLGKQLKGDLSGFWRYRIGDYRAYAHVDEEKKTVVVVKIGHRREVYK